MAQFVAHKGGNEYPLEQLRQNADMTDLHQVADGASISHDKEH